jgi:hypothetical protein
VFAHRFLECRRRDVARLLTHDDAQGDLAQVGWGSTRKSTSCAIFSTAPAMPSAGAIGDPTADHTNHHPPLRKSFFGSRDSRQERGWDPDSWRPYVNGRIDGMKSTVTTTI